MSLQAAIDEREFHNSLQGWQKLLLRAADEIENRGWGQRSFHNEATGEVCIAGAIGFATGLSKPGYDWSKARETLSDYLGTGLVNWNDNRCSSKQEAIRALQIAALG